MVRPLRNISNETSKTASTIRYLIAELLDGVSIKLVRQDKEATIVDFFTGKVDELPLKVVIQIEE